MVYVIYGSTEYAAYEFDEGYFLVDLGVFLPKECVFTPMMLMAA